MTNKIFITAGLLLFVLFNSLSCSHQKQKNSESKMTDSNAKPFLGIAFEGTKGIEKLTDYEFSTGIKVLKVLYGTAAWKAGLKRDDIILTYDSREVAQEDEKKIVKDFQTYIQKKKKIGDKIVLKILRKKTKIDCRSNKRNIDCRYKDDLKNLLDSQSIGEKLDFSIEDKKDDMIFSIVLGSKSDFYENIAPTNADLFPEFEKVTPLYAKQIMKIIRQYNLETRYAQLLKQYAENENVGDGFRLNLIRYMLKDPLKLPVVTDIKTASFEATAKDCNIKELIREASRIIDGDISGDIESNQLYAPFPKTDNAGEFIKFIKKTALLSLEKRQMAFRNLTEDEVALLEKHLPDFFNHFSAGKDISEDDNESFIAKNMETIRIAQKVDYMKLLYSAWILAELTDRKFLHDFHGALKIRKPSVDITLDGVSGEILYTEETSFGRIIIGGLDSNIYMTDAAVIIDLGGNDIYTNRAGAANKDKPVSVLIDFNGNDQYSSTDEISLGSGSLGTGILMDMDGDDIYTGLKFSQGTGLLGTGILVDISGNDRYEGQECCQGMALWGCGILLDYDGNDNYSSALYSQGVGMIKAHGVLWDGAGDDTYLALGKYPSSYGTSGIFDGLSQGFGVGFRNYASGGIGMLIDSGGKDIFRAGNFSQGCGYYFGLGILKNSGKDDDTFTASRYGQGAAAHSAAGILIDEGGNDTYRGLKGALQAAAWDFSIAALIDHSGNDVYDTARLFFSQPDAAHSGFSMLIDSSGKDSYNFPNPMETKTIKEKEDKSFAFLIDFGGETDFYNNQTRINNTTTLNGAYKVIADMDR